MNPEICGRLLLCGVMLTLCSCGPDPKVTLLLEESKELGQKVRALEEQNTQAVKAARTAEKNLETLRAESTAKEEAGKAALKELQKKAEDAVKALEDYQSKYRISARKKASGVKLDLLDCGEEGKFTAVEVLNLTPGEVRFRHASGITSMPLGLLNEELRERLGYNAQEAEQWQEQVAAKKEAEAADALIAESEAATAQIKKLGKPGNSGINVAHRNRLQSRLYSLNLSSRQLMVNNKCCPVHKKWQLGLWSKEINQLRVQIAKLPVVKGLE